MGDKMKRILTAGSIMMMCFTSMGLASASEGTGSITTRLAISCACTMGNGALAFTNTVSNDVTSDWDDSGNLTFACSNGANYEVGGKREAGVGGSIQLVNADGKQVPYSLTANGVNVPSTTLVSVQAGTATGLSSFINIPITINVAAADINEAEPSTYANVATFEVYLPGTGSCSTKSLYE
jgi:hypothetical protein